MTKDKIIEMARQSGFDWSGKELTWENVICTEELEAFAKLIAQHEREQNAKICQELAKDMTPVAEFAAKLCAKSIEEQA